MKLIHLLIALVCAIALSCCIAPPRAVVVPEPKPSAEFDAPFDPLDEPGFVQPTVREVHSKNVGLITSNPGHQIR